MAHPESAGVAAHHPPPSGVTRDIGISPALFLATFVIAIDFAIWQYRQARIARQEHHRSAGAAARHEPRAPDEPHG